MSKERIEILKAEIAERELELKSLTTRLINEETDVHRKFQIWANNGLQKKQDCYIPDGALRSWLDEHSMLDHSRGVINLLDQEEYFGLFSETDEKIKEWDCEEDIEALKNDSLFIQACEYMIAHNIDSFAIDW